MQGRQMMAGWRRGALVCLIGFACGGGALAAAPASPTLERIEARQALYVGYREDALPFSYVLPGQTEPTGYVWEICSHVFAAVWAQLGRPLPVVPVSVTDNARTMMLKTGITDLDCGAEGNTVARLEQVSFSDNIYVSEIRVMVAKGGGLDNFDQLAGKRIVTVAGGTAERQLKLAALGHNIAIRHLLADTPAEAMAMLAKGEADAYAGAGAVLAAQRASRPEAFVLLDAVLATEPYGIMLPKDDPVWKKLVDDTLVGLMRSGELTKIYNKWFVEAIPPSARSLGLPMNSLLEAAIREPSDTPVN